MRESEIEKKARLYAERLGIAVRKFVSPSRTGVPDRIFVGPKGVFFIEFKRPGQKPEPIQCYEMMKLNEARGEPCAFWCDNFESAKAIIDQLL